MKLKVNQKMSLSNDTWKPNTILITIREVDNAIDDAISAGDDFIPSPVNAMLITKQALLKVMNSEKNT